MDINPRSVTQFAVSVAVSIGTGRIVGAIIKNNVRPETVLMKVAVVAATWTIGAIVTEATKKYTDDMIDDLFDTAKKIAREKKLENKVDRVNKGLSTFEKEGLDPSKFQKNKKNIWVFTDSNPEDNPPEFLMKPGEGWRYSAKTKTYIRSTDEHGATWTLRKSGSGKWELALVGS